MNYAPVPLTLHALLDTAFVLASVAAPWLLGYADQLLPTLYTFGLTAIGFGLNAVTQYPVGIWRVLPFTWHKAIEFTSPIPFIVVPWQLFPDAGLMPWFTTALGVGIVMNAAFTRRQSVAALATR